MKSSDFFHLADRGIKKVKDLIDTIDECSADIKTDIYRIYVPIFEEVIEVVFRFETENRIVFISRKKFDFLLKNGLYDDFRNYTQFYTTLIIED